MQPPTDDGIKLFRLAAEYRRCGVYVLLGGLATATTGCCLSHVGIHPPLQPGAIAFGVVFFIGAPVIFCLMCFRWRLRVDDRGLWRRRLFRWDLWPWEAFADGRIERGPHFFSFVWTERPFWRRTLAYEFVEPHGRDFVRNVVWEISGPDTSIANAETIPDSLTITSSISGKSHWPHRAVLSCSPSGFVVTRRNREQSYLWSDVRELRIIRSERGRATFVLLELELPDDLVVFRTHQGRLCYWGADGQVFEAYLRRNIAAERVLVATIFDEPQTKREAEYHLKETQRKLAEQVQKKWIIFGIDVAYVVAIAAAVLSFLFQNNRFEVHDLARVLLLAIPHVILASALWWFYCRTLSELRAKICRLDEWSDRADATSS